ncbi:uncharacterized protein [Anoplolepis gracilipes]|uniref:uncharacterized protein isoform X2 n=1 Tax=Anoplolepis gracilipes TaxID=354296 RepID=UPI003B9E296C
MIFDLLVAGAFALATLRRYSAQIVIVLFILNSGLSSVSGGCEQSTSVGCTTEYYEYDTVNITEPWSRPCGTMLTSVTTKRQQQRHSVHRTLKKVQLKMRIARNSFKDLRKETQETYQNIKGMQKDAKYKFNWLPKDSLMWYCKKVMCLEKEKKPQRLLPYLYDNLQRFAITFHELQKFRLNTSAKDNMHVYRDWMIDVTFNQILQMLCEVENAMYNLQIDLPTPNNSSIITPKFWSKESDITQMLIQDWGVLKIILDQQVLIMVIQVFYRQHTAY